MHLPVGTLLQGGKYRIESTIGQGGFGITYKGVQVGLERTVAIKEFFMKEHCDRNGVTSHVSVPSTGSRELVERFKQKFLKEARVIASFENSHIVRVTDVFEENGTAYYVMDYLAGDSLASLVAKNGVIDEERALSYIRQVCDALVEVHSRNLLHLDIKPANIMLNNKGEAVLIDFGISKHYDESGNQTSSALIGISEGFAPLEQYEAGALNSFTPATDIYAVGATLYFMLTGMRPPKASDVMNEGLPALPKGVSSATRNAIMGAMNPRRKARPQTVKGLMAFFGARKEKHTVLEDAGVTELIGSVGSKVAEQDTKYALFLQWAGPLKLAVVKAIKESCCMELIKAKNIVDSAPCVICSGLSLSEAVSAKKNIEQSGAKVSMERCGEAVQYEKPFVSAATDLSDDDNKDFVVQTPIINDSRTVKSTYSGYGPQKSKMPSNDSVKSAAQSSSGGDSIWGAIFFWMCVIGILVALGVI